MKDMIKLVDLKLIPEKLWKFQHLINLRTLKISFIAKTEEAKAVKKMY